MIDELLDIVWPRGVPRRLDQLVDRPLCASLLQEFKLGLILACAPAPGDSALGPAPPRLAVSDQQEPTRWERRVLVQWPSPHAARFLGQVPPTTRRMADSDGSEQVVLYLDDLQAVDHRLAPPAHLSPQELMCATLALPQQDRGWLTRHTEPPLHLLTGSLLRRTRSLLELGARGLWSLRWHATTVTGVLWITESRWRDNPDASQAVVTALLAAERAPDGLLATREALQRHVSARDHRTYPDAVELTASGGIDLTLGFLTI